MTAAEGARADESTPPESTKRARREARNGAPPEGTDAPAHEAAHDTPAGPPDGAQTPPEPGAGGADANPLAGRVKALEEEQNRLKAELADQRDRFLRARADYDNLARRTQKEAVDAARTAKAGLLMRLAGLTETLERAAADVRQHHEEAAKGVHLVLDEARRILKDEGVREVEGVGHMFNYQLHQAVERVPTPDAAEGTIVDVVQRGYTMGQDVLRPALVKVAVPVPAKPAGTEPGAGAQDAPT